jgi:hypothetical protein
MGNAMMTKNEALEKLLDFPNQNAETGHVYQAALGMAYVDGERVARTLARYWLSRSKARYAEAVRG